MNKENANVKWYKGERVIVWTITADNRWQSARKGIISGTRHIIVSGKWYKVPRIQLDSGKSILGYKCWWISEKGYERLERDLSKSRKAVK